MKKDKIEAVLDEYEHSLIEIGYMPEEHDKELPAPTRWAAYNHVLTMIPKMRKFLEEGRIEKTMRWLGFIQGVFFYGGFYSINDLRYHNMPNYEESNNEESN